MADYFGQDARYSTEDNGVPGPHMATVAVEEHYKYYKRRATRSKEVAEGSDALIVALVSPLAADKGDCGAEKRSTAKTIRKNTAGCDPAFEKFNRLFLDNRWGIGLPLMPPTRGRRVKWTLSRTHRSPDEMIDRAGPKNGIRHGAGCHQQRRGGAKRGYLPVIVTAMEASAKQTGMCRISPSLFLRPTEPSLFRRKCAV